MPSFAKKPVDSKSGGLADVFSDEEVKEVLQTVKDEARSLVKGLIQKEIPAYIKHLNGLLAAAESDSSSPLWKGHLDSGPFVKDNIKLIHKEPRRKDRSSPGTPTIVVRGVDGLSLDPNYAPEGEQAGQDPLSPTDNEMTGKRWEGGLEANDVCNRLSVLVEAEAEKSRYIGRELMHWLRLEIPTLEDGNNFGVDVQEEMIRKVDNMIGAAARFRSLPKGHFEDRMALAMQWNKYPNLKDHAAAIASSDRHDFFLLCNAISKLRGNMAVLLTALRNNWAKAHNPKDAEHASALDSMY